MCWASSLAIGFPIMFGLNQRPDGEDPGLVEEVNFCGFYNPEFIIYSSLGSFYIPCLVMVVLYSSIFKVVTPKVKSVKAKKGKKKKKDNQRKERKATQTLAIVLASFLVCWLPFFTCNILDAISIKFSLNTAPGNFAFQATTLLGYLNSCLNPI